ncbi:MAG: putative metal-dependent hydrolase [Gammaproteobacteria bacterium]|jgi:predicted metal-dependent hydrolase
MSVHRLNGTPPIDVSVRRSARARKLSLRVSRLDGKVTLTVPQRSPLREGIHFLETRELWLRTHLIRLAPEAVVAAGGTVPYRGDALPVVVGAVKRTVMREGTLQVPDAPTAGVRAKAFLKLRARDELAAASDRYAAQVDRTYNRLSIRDTRSRWGSCSSEGVLMYSWRLIMAPPAVLDYVAAHEVAHLVEMNHSDAFWAVVERICPEYAAHRAWLRNNGDVLHRVNFGD